MTTGSLSCAGPCSSLRPFRSQWSPPGDSGKMSMTFRRPSDLGHVKDKLSVPLLLYSVSRLQSSASWPLFSELQTLLLVSGNEHSTRIGSFVLLHSSFCSEFRYFNSRNVHLWHTSGHSRAVDTALTPKSTSGWRMRAPPFPPSWTFTSPYYRPLSYGNFR